MVNKNNCAVNKVSLPRDWIHSSMLHQNVRYNCLCLRSGKLCLHKETTDLLDWRLWQPILTTRVKVLVQCSFYGEKKRSSEIIHKIT